MTVRTGNITLTRRGFMATAAAAGAGYLVYRGARFYIPTSNARAKVVIVGGGAAGISIAARLCRALEKPDITLIDPSSTHYYQPGFTLIGAGVFKPGQVLRTEAEFIPRGVKWLQDRVIEADPDHNAVTTAAHGVVKYDFMVLCPGLQMDFDAIEGIHRDTLGRGNVHCIYDYQSAQNCWGAIQKLAQTGGRAVFSDTWTKLKCGGAPKKINLIAEDYCRQKGMRNKVDFRFVSAVDHVFDAPLFRERLEQIYSERNIPIVFNHRIKSVDCEKRTVTFEKRTKTPSGTSAELVTLDYDFLHIVPPMSAPDFVKQSPLVAVQANGTPESWAATDKSTLVHARYKNVMAVGDVAGIPTSKTAAAVRVQAPIAVANLIALMEGKALPHKYDGYTACPIVTQYGKVLMAEFGYDKKPRPSLPFLDPGREHEAGWFLKVHVLRPMYFDGMLKGLV
jgi:sulfide:quinone oxidoreductase